MADLSITATEVQPGGTYETRIAAAAVSAGEPVRMTAAKQFTPAQADTASNAAVYGIAVSDAAEGQPVSVQRAGTVTIGSSASVAQGETYVLSATAGGIAPDADLTTSDYVTTIGVGTGSDGIDLCINASGEAHA